MAINEKYMSRDDQRGQDRKTAKISYYGPEAELKAWAATLHVGGTLAALSGSITSIRVYPDGGGTWACDVSAELQYDDDGNPSDPTTSTGPNSQRLAGGRLSLDLEKHPNYRASWDHQLLFKVPEVAPGIPSWYLAAKTTDIPEADQGKYQWIKPGETVPEGWMILYDVDSRFKGMTSFDWSMYTITETGKHASKTQAGWISAKALNSIVDSPDLGDFGLTAKFGGNWKVEDVNVYYDGRHWLADRSYTKSGDSNGWNPAAYPDQNGDFADPENLDVKPPPEE